MPFAGAVAAEPSAWAAWHRKLIGSEPGGQNAFQVWAGRAPSAAVMGTRPGLSPVSGRLLKPCGFRGWWEHRPRSLPPASETPSGLGRACLTPRHGQPGAPAVPRLRCGVPVRPSSLRAREARVGASTASCHRPPRDHPEAEPPAAGSRRARLAPGEGHRSEVACEIPLPGPYPLPFPRGLVPRPPRPPRTQREPRECSCSTGGPGAAPAEHAPPAPAKPRDWALWGPFPGPHKVQTTQEGSAQHASSPWSTEVAATHQQGWDPPSHSSHTLTLTQ